MLLTLFRLATGTVGASGLYSPRLWLYTCDWCGVARAKCSPFIMLPASIKCCVLCRVLYSLCLSPRDTAKISLSVIAAVPTQITAFGQCSSAFGQRLCQPGPA